MAERSKNGKYIIMTVAVWRDPKNGSLHVTGKDPMIRKLGLPGVHMRPMPASATERTLDGLMEHVLGTTTPSPQQVLKDILEAMTPEQRRRVVNDVLAQHAQPNPQFLEGERDYNDLSPE